jgi:excisionase family DNA binding protein
MHPGPQRHLDPIVVTTEEAKALLRIGHSKLAELIASGELRSTRLGARRLIYLESIRALLAAGEEAPAA